MAGVTLGGSLIAQAAGSAALGGAVGGLIGFGAGKAVSAIGNKVSNATSSAEGFDTWLNKGEANNKVYFGIKDNEPQYTGITKQNLEARLQQHNTNGKGFSNLRGVDSGLTRNQARSIEQYYIENGPNDLNKINSISPDNKYYNDAMNWAKNYLGVD